MNEHSKKILIVWIMKHSSLLFTAMLTVSDDVFWEGVGAVELGDMPSPRDKLTVMYYLQYRNSITSESGFIQYMGMINYLHGGALKLPAFEVSYRLVF